MRFSFRKTDAAPRWVDCAEFGWVPEEPLRTEPTPGNDTGRTDDWRREPRATPPDATPEPRGAAAPKLEAPPPVPANKNAAPSLLLPRLGIGLAQGLCLFILVQSRNLGMFPGSDPYLFAACALALLFAPLVLLEGLGEIENGLLYVWTGIVAATLASLGLYHHWRIQGPEQAHAGFALAVLTALMLVIAQGLLRAGVKDGRLVASYRSYFDTLWTLAARLAVWAVLTGIAWALIGSGNSLFNWLRAHYPALRLSIEPSLLILPLLGVASAAAMEMTTAKSWTRRQMRRALLACCTVALPMLVMASLAVLADNFLTAPVSLALSLSFAALLVVCINASYRGEARGAWRRGSEFAAAFLIVALVMLAVLALEARVSAFGWTAGRLYAAASIAVLGLYGVLYSGAALISIGGGLWMQRIEGANLAMAVVVIAVCLALSSPPGDALKLAVAAQAQRLESGAVSPPAFDFAWLRRDGARFGQGALAAMLHSPSPEIARAAAITLSTAPGAAAPTPTEIGANITVRTAGARLPNRLLAQDWAAAGKAVPPCLTKPALPCDAWFLDLDGDGLREILLVYGNDARWWASVMKESRAGDWSAAATLASPHCPGLLSALRAGNFAPADPLPGWRDLLVAGLRLTPASAPQAELPCRR